MILDFILMDFTRFTGYRKHKIKNLIKNKSVFDENVRRVKNHLKLMYRNHNKNKKITVVFRKRILYNAFYCKFLLSIEISCFPSGRRNNFNALAFE